MLCKPVSMRLAEHRNEMGCLNRYFIKNNKVIAALTIFNLSKIMWLLKWLSVTIM